MFQFVDKISNKDAEKIRTGERALVVLSEITNHSSKHMALYGFVEKSGIALALSQRLHYRKFVVLSGANADADDFCETLAALGSKRKIDAIDVLMHMHGKPNRMMFNKPMKSDVLQREIAGLRLGHKLRMFYTTACFGATHAKDMVQAGFSCGSGAVGVNANAATEYPEFLRRWISHDEFGDCIRKSYNRRLTRVFERKARKMDWDDVDSRKRIFGDENTTIITPP